MLTVTIVNTGDHEYRPEYGHYTYTVAVNRDVIAQGVVKDHRRADGWEQLVERVVQHEISAAFQQRAAAVPQGRQP